MPVGDRLLGVSTPETKFGVEERASVFPGERGFFAMFFYPIQTLTSDSQVSYALHSRRNLPRVNGLDYELALGR